MLKDLLRSGLYILVILNFVSNKTGGISINVSSNGNVYISYHVCILHII